MPIYTYECEECGARFEARQSFNDTPLTVCPTCEGKIHRVIQSVGVVFKGSGFYVNDSRSKQSLATSGAKKEDGKTAESGSTELAAPTTKSEGASETASAQPAAEAATPAKTTASSDTAK